MMMLLAGDIQIRTHNDGLYDHHDDGFSKKVGSLARPAPCAVGVSVRGGLAAGDTDWYREAR